MHTVRMKRLSASAARAANHSVGFGTKVVTFQYGSAVIDDDELAQKIKADFGQVYLVERMTDVDMDPPDADIEKASEADPVMPPPEPAIPVVSDIALEAIKRHRSPERIINTVLADVQTRNPKVLYKLLLGLRDANKAIKMPKKKLQAALQAALEQEKSEG